MNPDFVEISTQQVSQAQIDELAIFESYKKSLSEVQLVRAALYAEIDSSVESLNNLVNAQDDLFSMFIAEALQMYPELQQSEEKDIMSILNSLATGHPLLDLWDQYAIKIEAQDAKIQSLDSLLATYEQSEADLLEKENEILDSYLIFKSTASSNIPSIDDLITMVQANASLYKVEESSTVLSLPAIEELDPVAASMVTLQTLNNENPEEFANVVSKISESDVLSSKPIDKKYLYAAAVVLAWFILGGKKS